MPLLSKAFVYAAGYGTRLRPYTYETPKPMLDVFGRPLIEYVLCYLRRAGLEQVTINAAWLSEAFADLPERGRALGLDVRLSVQPEPLEHGGDLAAATVLLDGLNDDEPFLALNGDTLFWLDLSFLHEAAASVSEATPLLIVGRTTDANPLHIANNRLVGIGTHRYFDVEPDDHLDDFGIKVFHASIRRHLPPPGTTMSLHGSDGLIGRLAAEGRKIRVLPAPAYERAEIGTVEDYEGCATNAALHTLTQRLCS